MKDVRLPTRAGYRCVDGTGKHGSADVQVFYQAVVQARSNYWTICCETLRVGKYAR